MLREAGVVDAGAAGLVEIVRGIQFAALRRGAARRPASTSPSSASTRSTRSFRATATAPSSSSRETISTPTSSRPSSSSSATRCSSSATRPRSRCTCTPTTPVARSRSASRAGSIGGVEIANMHAQTHAARGAAAARRPTERPSGSCAVVAVVAGAGNRALFESFGAIVVDGGTTMNPSTADLLEAIETRSGRRGRRPAEQRQRDHERRAGCRARVEARPRRADAVDAGGPRGARRVRHVAPARRRTRRRWGRRPTAVATGAVTSPRATCS